MKIHTQTRTTISGFMLVTFLSLNSAIAHSQENQKSNGDITQVTNVNLNKLPSISKKLELEKLKSKTKLSHLPEIPLLPALDVVATRSAVAKLKNHPI